MSVVHAERPPIRPEVLPTPVLRAAPPVLLAVGFLARIAVALRPLAVLDSLVMPDDAYLCLTVARSLGHGLGPRFGLGPTNGFQPLYVLLMAPFYALFPGRDELGVHVALILCIACDTLLAVLLCRFARELASGPVAPAFVAAWWCLDPYAMRMALCGMETSLSALLAGATLFALWRARARKTLEPRAFVGLGVLGGAAVLARVDSLVLAGVLLATVAWDARRETRARLVRPALVAAGAGAILVPWAVYIRTATGDVVPTSGRAVRYLATAYNRGGMTDLEWLGFQLDWAWELLLRDHRPLLVATALLLVALLFAGATRAREFAESARPLGPTLLYAAGLFLAYPLVVWSFWYYPRYYYPLMILLLLVPALLTDFLVRLAPRHAWGGALAAACLVGPLVLGAADADVRGLFVSSGPRQPGYRDLGLWAVRRFPPGTRIASVQSGGLAYFAPGLEVVNLDGVVNREALDAIERRRLLDYLRESGATWMVGWEPDLELLTFYSRERAQDVLERLEPVPGGRAPTAGPRSNWWHDWYLWRLRAPG